MKNRGYLILLIILILPILTYAAHTVSITLPSSAPKYETNDVLFGMRIENDITSVDAINNVNLNTAGVSYTNVLNPSSWNHLNSTDNINWSGQLISNGGSQIFQFNAKLNQVNSDTTYNWDVKTVDTNGDEDTGQISVTVLNDAINPSVTLNNPLDYGFVKNEAFDFNIDVSDSESGIDASLTPEIVYSDNNNPQSIGLVNDSLSFSGSSPTFTLSFEPATKMSISTGLRYLNYVILNVKDNAGNSFLDSARHIYIDTEAPEVVANFDEGFATSSDLNDFSYNLTENSFETKAFAGFDPTLTCTLSIDSFELTEQFNSNQTPVVLNADLSSLSDGNYNTILTCQDSATYLTTHQSNFNLDRTGPEITITSPSPTSKLIANGTAVVLTTLDFIGTDSVWYDTEDENGDIISGYLIGTSPYLIDTSNWLEGENYISIYANDTLNNIGYLDDIITIDANPPTITLNSPLQDSFSSSSIIVDYYVEDTVSSDLSCTLIADHLLKDIVVQNNATSYSTVEFESNLDATGQWVLAVECADEVGHLGNSQNITITIDNTLPEVNLLNPTHLQFFNKTETTFLVSALDDSGLSECNLYLDNNNINSISSPGSDVSFINDITEGEHSWYTECRDTVGNLGISEIRKFTVDLTQPQITINYNKLILEKQIDSIITNFTIIDENKNYQELWVEDSTNSILKETIFEDNTIGISGLNLGVGMFTINAFANDSAQNTNSSLITFEVIDTLPPSVLTSFPENKSTFDSSTTLVNITLTTDESATCRYNESDITYGNMIDFTSTNSNTHSLNITTFSDKTYNYYILCSDGINVMSSSKHIQFIVNPVPQSPGGSSQSSGGGGGGGDDEPPLENNIVEEEELLSPINNNPQVEEEPELNADAGEEAFKEETKEEIPPTGFAILDTVNKYKEEAGLTALIIAAILLGTYGAIRFRRWKKFRFHKP